MTLSASQAFFAAGMARAAQHWLDFWQHNGHDAEAQRQARGHALRALTWCAEWGTAPETTADLAVALHGYIMQVGQWHEWEACLRRVLVQTRAHIDEVRRYELQFCLAFLYFRLHRLDDAIALAQDNERLAVAAGDIRRQQKAVSMLAETYLNGQRFDLALDYAERARALAIIFEDTALQADSLINMARALLGLNRLDEAEEHLLRADRLVIEANNAVYQCKARLFLGHAAAARGEWRRSLDYCSDALALVQSYGDEAGYAVIRSHAGRALLELGRWDEATQALTEALRLHRYHGNAPAEQVCLQRLQDLHTRQAGRNRELPC
jgi:tetratricopeptide (TPR) repeat protein